MDLLPALGQIVARIVVVSNEQSVQSESTQSEGRSSQGAATPGAGLARLQFHNDQAHTRARRELNETADRKISVNDLVVRAMALALREVPDANVGFNGDTMLRYRHSDISVAIATDSGLVTPVVRAADSLSISNVSAVIGGFSERARAGRIRPDELVGGSFTVSNLGMFGTKEFSAILNPPQAGILAVGAATPRAVVTNGELGVATVMTCTLSADHRVVDGAVAAQLVEAFKRRMENPLSILL